MSTAPRQSYLFTVIASPAAAYFPSGIKPVTVWLSRGLHPGRTRAAPARPSAAATTRPRSPAQQQAVDNGCDQVVWLDAAERRWVEEMGGMNLFFVYGTGAGRQDHDPVADRHPAARQSPATRC